MSSKTTTDPTGNGLDELIYFNIRGRAETMRLLYIVSDKKFTDTRIELGAQGWVDMKNDMPYRQLPILKRGNVVIPQSMAIARLLAKENGLAGRNDLEQAIVDSVVDGIENFANPGVDIFVFEQDEKKKAERAEEFMAKVLPEALENLNRVIENNPTKSNYFVGEEMLWCDILFYVVADRFVLSDPETLTKYPHLNTLYQTVAAHPKIAKWIEERPKTAL